MTYRATIFKQTGAYSKDFNSIQAAGEWLDSENDNLENTTMIETFDEAGNKKDGFFYTEKK